MSRRKRTLISASHDLRNGKLDALNGSVEVAGRARNQGAFVSQGRVSKHPSSKIPRCWSQVSASLIVLPVLPVHSREIFNWVLYLDSNKSSTPPLFLLLRNQSHSSGWVVRMRSFYGYPIPSPCPGGLHAQDWNTTQTGIFITMHLAVHSWSCVPGLCTVGVPPTNHWRKTKPSLYWIHTFFFLVVIS